jgi:hypothetical protein
VAAARRLLAIYARLGESVDVQERAGYAAANACVMHAEGRHAEAVSAGLRTVEFGETLGLDGQDAKMGFMWALEAAIAMGDRAKADEIVERIEAIPPGLRPPSLGAHVNRARARLADTAELGEVHAAAAAATFRDLGLRFWASVAQLERAELVAADGRGEEAEPLAAEARAVFTELGAVPWIARADAVTNRASAEAVG